METGNLEETICDEKMFKSYYVVWKQLRYSDEARPRSLFKSYYVVWKPQANKSWAKQSPEFKSYYVVWKRECSESIIFIFECLNRTM